MTTKNTNAQPIANPNLALELPEEEQPLPADVLHLVYEVADIMRVNAGEQEPRASVLAQIVVNGLRHRMGGGTIYIMAPSRVARNKGIRAMFNGKNLKEVCAKFNVQKTTVYKLARPCKIKAG